MGCLGFAALMAADAFTAPAAFWVVAVAMVLYGVRVPFIMYCTRQRSMAPSAIACPDGVG
jgi:hypothetical protein